jgi:hypothetical protein
MMTGEEEDNLTNVGPGEMLVLYAEDYLGEYDQTNVDSKIRYRRDGTLSSDSAVLVLANDSQDEYAYLYVLSEKGAGWTYDLNARTT